MKKLELSPHRIAASIYVIRGQKVMLDADLATLYGVSVKRLNEQVKRNKRRFPEDFMFQITPDEIALLKLRSHFATSRWGGRRYLPYAFTEHGIAMLSSVLNSTRAIDVNIAIMRAFVRMRQLLLENKDLALRLERLEQKVDKHGESIHSLLGVVGHILAVEEKPKRRIGFVHGGE